MRYAVLAIGLMLGSSSAALAGDEIMANYFGNTIIATSQAGELRVHYKPDHSFSGRAEGPVGKYDIRGTWKFDGQGNLCRTYSTNGSDLPPGLPNPYCAPWSAHNVGDVWTVVGQDGKTAEVKLVAGRH
jgi:hypothetical protein